MYETLHRDLGLAVRSLVRGPGFSAAVILTLALGIGGTTIMFAAVNAAYLEPLAYPGADQVALVRQTARDSRQVGVSMLNSLDWARRNRSFEHLATFGRSTINVTDGADPERVTVAYVTGDFFAALGVLPARGRTFDADELRGVGSAAVISDGLWRRIFGRDPAVLERRLQLEGVAHPIVGVMPPGFGYPENAELWLPLPTDEGTGRGDYNYTVIGRLANGVSLPQAQADMEAVVAALAREYPAENGGYGVAVVPLRRDLLGTTGPLLLVMLGAVSLVLVVACANVANLLLARVLARRGEVSVRFALGGTGLALVRPFMLESVLLSLAGGALGLALATAGNRFLIGLVTPIRLLDEAALRPDGRVLLFAFLVALAVACLCGLVPVLEASRRDLRGAIAASGRGTAAGSRRMRALVGGEVAVAFVLLVGAGLLLTSAWRLGRVDPGLVSEDRAILRFAMGGHPASHYNDPQWRSGFFSRLLEAAATLPGVERVGMINELPLTDPGSSGTLEIDAAAASEPQRLSSIGYRAIGGDYFGALGIPLLAGEAPPAAPRPDGLKVAVVNRRLARALGGVDAALGLRVAMPEMDGVEDPATVVAVVGDVRHRGLDATPVPEVYFPFTQRPLRTWTMSVVVEPEASAEWVATQVRERARELDSGLPVTVLTIEDVLTEQLARARFRAGLLTAFAVTALVLSGIGIFGVIAYTVRRRVREIGIRMALGADRGRVRGLVVRKALEPVVIGMACGAAAAFALTRFLAAFLFEVDGADPAVFLSVAAVLGGTALIASLLPARWATRVDQVEVLRAE